MTEAETDAGGAVASTTTIAVAINNEANAGSLLPIPSARLHGPAPAGSGR